MNSTQEYTLEQLGTFEKSYSFSRALEGDGEYRHIHYGDIHTKLPYVIQKSEVLPTITENQTFDTVQYGDILIADASEDYKDLGKAICFLDSSDTKVISGLHTHRFRPNVSLVAPEYLINLFQTNRYRKFVWKMGTGVSVLGLSKTNLAKYTVTIPSLAMQENIANHFLNLNKKIQLQQEKIDLLKEQKKGYMQKIFSQELRFKGFKNTWKEKKLSDISIVITKGTTPKDKSWTGTVNYIKTESINPISGEISNTAYTSLEEHEGYLKRSQLQAGDILFSIVGTLGRVGLVKEKDLPANTNQQIAIIRLKSEIDRNFILNVLKSTKVLSFINSDSTIGAQPSLSLWQINALQIPYTSYEEQKKIGEFFQILDKAIALQTQKLEILQKQKQAFMQQMFI